MNAKQVFEKAKEEKEIKILFDTENEAYDLADDLYGLSEEIVCYGKVGTPYELTIKYLG